MKNILLKPFIVFITLSLFFISCSSNDTTDAPDLYTISLDFTKLQFKTDGGKANIEITSNKSWITNNLPDWITLNNTSGDKSQTIIVTAKANELNDERTTNIVFKNGDASVVLSIIQEAKTKDFQFIRLPFSTFDDYNFVLGPENKERRYTFLARRLFFAPNNKDLSSKIFLGNLIDRNLESNTNIKEYKGLTFNEMTAFPAYFGIPAKII